MVDPRKREARQAQEYLSRQFRSPTTQTLTNAGNTVLVIEHNLNVIKVADYLIDLGKEGGTAGGTLVVSGTPEEVAACADSYTGNYLKAYL